MEELYAAIEKKIKASGYPREISGADVYDDICDQIEGKENGSYILLRKNAKANTVTTIFTTKAHAEIEMSAPENAQMGAEAQAYSAFSPCKLHNLYLES